MKIRLPYSKHYVEESELRDYEANSLKDCRSKICDSLNHTANMIGGRTAISIAAEYLASHAVTICKLDRDEFIWMCAKAFDRVKP